MVITSFCLLLAANLVAAGKENGKSLDILDSQGRQLNTTDNATDHSTIVPTSNLSSQLVVDSDTSESTKNSTLVPRSNFVTLEEDCNHTCANNCSDGWIQFEEKCYKWSKDEKTWEDAERFCRSEGGHLASVS